MSKLLCRCGQVISNTVHPSPTEGIVVGQQSRELIERESIPQIRSFVEALLVGRRKQWIDDFFGAELGLSVISDELVINDIVAIYLSQHERRMSECERCGRLWVQSASKGGKWLSYAPDDGAEYCAILSSDK